LSNTANGGFYGGKTPITLPSRGEHIFPLREYPVLKVLSVHAARAGAALQGEPLFTPESLVDPKHYYCIPDEGIQEDIPFSLVLCPPLRLSREEMGIKARYVAGYSIGKAPADLASACLELAAWNMSRYRGRKFFYVSASAIFVIYSFAFSGPLLSPVISKGSGFMVLVSAVGALLFTILAFRVLFPGLPLLEENGPETPAYSAVQTIFREHGLTEREAEVAHLIVLEGLSNQNIAECIFHSKFTVEKYVTSIYQKFEVPDWAAFVAKVLR
jgi:DNA-binding CsgD family transcriptional regulator